MYNEYNEFNYKGPLCLWVGHNEIENGVEVYFDGKYYFKIEERLYYIDLCCSIDSYTYCRMFTHLKTGESFSKDIPLNNFDAKDRKYKIQGFRDACVQFVEVSAIKYEERIKKLENGRVLIEDDYWNEMNISSFDNTPEYMPWPMVDQCGKEFKNERILITVQTCPTCGSPIVKSKFSTCLKSWRHLAEIRQHLGGIEGWIWFCPKCKKQLQQTITALMD